MVGRVLLFTAAALAAPGPAMAGPVHQYLAFGLGTGGTGELSRNALPDGLAVTCQLGQRVYRHLHVFGEIDDVIDGYGAALTILNERRVSLLAGVRWTLFSRSPAEVVQPAAVYVKAGLGLEEQRPFPPERPIPETGGWTPVLALAVDYLPLHAASWAFGAEARAQVNHPIGAFTRSWACTLLVEVTN